MPPFFPAFKHDAKGSTPFLHPAVHSGAFAKATLTYGGAELTSDVCPVEVNAGIAAKDSGVTPDIAPLAATM